MTHFNNLNSIIVIMDNIETTEPVESDGATSPADTSQVDTQSAEPADTVSDGETGEAEASTPLLAGKYKSPEELEKGYTELEKKLGDLGQKAKLADLIQDKYKMTPEQFQEAIDAEEQARFEQALLENPNLVYQQENEQLRGQLALKEEEGKLNSFIQANPEYEPFKDKLFNLYLNVEKDQELETVARDYFGQAIAKGQQDAYKKIDVKQKTQATGVSSVPKRQISIEDMKNMSVAELEAILPHADISHRSVR